MIASYRPVVPPEHSRSSVIVRGPVGEVRAVGRLPRCGGCCREPRRPAPAGPLAEPGVPSGRVGRPSAAVRRARLPNRDRLAQLLRLGLIRGDVPFSATGPSPCRRGCPRRRIGSAASGPTPSRPTSGTERAPSARSSAQQPRRQVDAVQRLHILPANVRQGIERRRQVDRPGDRFHHRPGGDLAGPADVQRRSDPAFVGAALLPLHAAVPGAPFGPLSQKSITIVSAPACPLSAWRGHAPRCRRCSRTWRGPRRVPDILLSFDPRSFVRPSRSVPSTCPGPAWASAAC